MKKVKTIEEFEAHEVAKALKRNYKSAIIKAQNIMKDTLKKQGLRIAELQIALIKSRAQEPLPIIQVKSISLNREEIIDAYEKAISDYKGALIRV